MDIQIGMKVELAKDLTSSIVQYGGSSAKRKIQGTFQMVHKVHSSSIQVKLPEKGGIWTILNSDVVGIKKYKPAVAQKGKVELFNPENLMVK